jgi:uncharacterized protein (TIGR01319 family)
MEREVMGLTLAVDFGSTYTKLVAFDLSREELVGVTQAKSSVGTDITIGLNEALEKMRLTRGQDKWNIDKILACSSAAGGLRIVALGLVKVLTTKAAEEAALGAGAKIIGTYSYGITADDVIEIEEKKPDLILLTGGTDGGNKEVLIENAKLLAKSHLNVPVVIAGNRIGARTALSVLTEANKYAVIEENVLPELDRLNVEPTRARIRDIFMRRITHAKGLDKAKTIVGDIIMPTPMAVLKGTALLAEGAKGERGMGELIVIDIGGATTDVHSVAHGHPIESDVTMKGLPEPYRKRTVEGDLGIRYNAQTILEKAGRERITKKMAFLNRELSQNINLEEKVEYLSCHIEAVPKNEGESLLDFGLASAALEIAIHRHAGRIKEFHLTCGKSRIQYGKDLRNIKTVVGTGGIFAYGNNPYEILKSTVYNRNDPESLRPIDPQFFIDERYILYAVGLLADHSPAAALRIMKNHLKRVEEG